MKKNFKRTLQKILPILFLITSCNALAAPDEVTPWARVSSLYAADAYQDFVRITVAAVIANPADCAGGTTGSRIDIETNKKDFELIMNSIYLSLATHIEMEFVIDGNLCSSAGQRLIKRAAIRSVN